MGATPQEIIEKIDIGGISLIRAAAKNYHDVIIVSGQEAYGPLLHLLKTKQGESDIEERRSFARQAFPQPPITIPGFLTGSTGTMPIQCRCVMVKPPPAGKIYRLK